MITNKHPYWTTVMADLEQEDPLFVRSHISAEFLEATCTDPSCASYANGSAAKDPFYLTPAERSDLQAKRPLRALWGEPTATTAKPDPCPYCGAEPWWADQDRSASAAVLRAIAYGALDEADDDDSDWHIDPQTGFACGRKRFG